MSEVVVDHFNWRTDRGYLHTKAADAGGTARRPNPPAVFCTIMPPAFIEYLTITRTPHAAAVVPPGCAAGSAALVCRPLYNPLSRAD
ncbi:hypothetical protein B5X24_HaOG205810 [Helicoverpa armigera]|nr:hypothetical protein B5X24_HaOG205810 [Helicoverpa armigera]